MSDMPIGVALLPVAGRDFLETTVPLEGAGDYRNVPIVRGVTMITISRSGSESLSIYVYRPGHATEIMAAIPSGNTGTVRRTVLEIGTELDGTYFRVRIVPRRATVDLIDRASVTIIPLPASGGGG